MGMTGVPVRPRDAASLVLTRDGRHGVEVLMGRRRPKAAFIPDAYVFPGGRVEPDDRRAVPAAPLTAETAARLGDAAMARALAVAAVRETFEETGLLLGGAGDVGRVAGPSWAAMRALGMAPALNRLSYIGRAITPTDSPIRFHARFFVAPARHVAGKLAGSGELLDLRWVTLEQARRLPIIDVTEFMLEEVGCLLSGDKPRGRAPLFSYRGNRPVVRYP